MTKEQFRAAIEAAFNTGWNNRTGIAWGNFPFTPPSGKAWVRFSINHTAGEQSSLGAIGDRVFRRFGFVVTQIFTPKGESMVESNTLAQAALNIFDGVDVSGAWFRNGRSIEIGLTEGFFQTNVQHEFIYEEIK